MKKEQLQELNEILLNDRGNLYDFICNNYYSLSKEDIKDLCKEAFDLLYTFSERLNGNDQDKHLKKVHREYYDNLKEWTDLLLEEVD